MNKNHTIQHVRSNGSYCGAFNNNEGKLQSQLKIFLASAEKVKSIPPDTGFTLLLTGLESALARLVAPWGGVQSNASATSSHASRP